jgi:hypothetical protein
MEMTGEIIRFEKLRDHRKGSPCAGQPVPRGSFSQGSSVGSEDLPSLEHQMARVAGLLEELEALTRTSRNIPLATRQRALNLATRARAVVQLSSRDPGLAEPDDGVQSDPQPAVDDERVERMYRDLNSD